jgi:hypothetical protein
MVLVCLTYILNGCSRKGLDKEINKASEDIDSIERNIEKMDNSITENLSTMVSGPKKSVK